MSDMAKQARAAMKAKAKSLTASTDPKTKVDSSTWTPPEPLNTTAKTGMRPISRRAFKSGGKVEGEKAKCNMGRAPRKSGGSTEAKQWMNAKINRNVKDANEEREGIKHVGGMKKGGRAKKAIGGAFGEYLSPALMAINALRGDKDEKKNGGRTNKQNGGGMSSGRGILTKDGKDVVGPTSMPATEERKAPPMPQRPQREPEKGMTGAEASEFMATRKHGGRAKKMMGGPMMQPGGMMGAVSNAAPASSAPPVGVDPNDPRFRMVPSQAMNFGQGARGTPYKKGGAAKHPDEAADKALFRKMEKAEHKKEGHEDEAMDKALIRKMVKPSARTGKQEGGETWKTPNMTTTEIKQDKQERTQRYKDTDTESHLDGMLRNALQKNGITPNYKKGGRAKRKEGGGVFSGPGYPGKVPGVTGGRIARADGGKTKAKGKTNINIIISAGKPASPEEMMPPGMKGPTPPPGMPGGAGSRPVPIPAPGGGGAAAPAMAMPIPMPIPMGGTPGAGPLPMGRKSGGRITKVASSYKDMEAGAGGGEGRLQKTDIAKKHKDAPAFKRGGRTYRSYKDMDAGAGSGLGRLEKTEIQARKG